MTLFEGRSIIVTGAASGIGRAIAEYLALQGAMVGIFDLNGEGAKNAAREIGDLGGKALGYHLDITNYQSASDTVEAFQNEAGPLYGLVNNAGWDEAKNFIDTEPDFWRKVIDINLYGPMNMTHVACRRMAEHGQGRTKMVRIILLS